MSLYCFFIFFLLVIRVYLLPHFIPFTVSPGYSSRYLVHCGFDPGVAKDPAAVSEHVKPALDIPFGTLAYIYIKACILDEQCLLTWGNSFCNICVSGGQRNVTMVSVRRPFLALNTFDAPPLLFSQFSSRQHRERLSFGAWCAFVSAICYFVVAAGRVGTFVRCTRHTSQTVLYFRIRLPRVCFG